MTIEAIEVPAAFALHDPAREPPEFIDEFPLGLVRLDPQIPPDLRRPYHRTRHVGLVNEDQPIAVRFREILENTAGPLSDTEAVPEKREYERGRIVPPIR